MSEELLDWLCFSCSMIILILAVLLIIKIIDYEVYVSNNLSEANNKQCEYDFASIKKYEKIISSLNLQSYTFYSEPKYVINESHIIFDGKMMILYPISYFKFVRRVLKRNRKRKRIKGLWKNYLK